MIDKSSGTSQEIARITSLCRGLRELGRESDALLEAVKLADWIPSSDSELAALIELSVVVERPTWAGLFCTRYLDVVDDPLARITLAHIYARQGNNDAAIAQLEAATRNPETSREILAKAFEATRHTRCPPKLAVSISERLLAFDPDSFVQRLSHVRTVSAMCGKEAAVPLIASLRALCGSEVVRWMMIAELQADLGLLRSGRRDFKSGLIYFNVDKVDEIYYICLVAGRLGLFDEMLDQVRALRNQKCLDITIWETVLQKGQEYTCGAIAQIAAEQLVNLVPSHAGACKFIQRGSSRMLFDKLTLKAEGKRNKKSLLGLRF